MKAVVFVGWVGGRVGCCGKAGRWDPVVLGQIGLSAEVLECSAFGGGQLVVGAFGRGAQIVRGGLGEQVQVVLCLECCSNSVTAVLYRARKNKTRNNYQK